MQLHVENTSVRFIAISLLIFLAASFVGYWYWSPYFAADRIKNAIESGDTAKMTKFINFPKVRLNIQRQNKLSKYASHTEHDQLKGFATHIKNENLGGVEIEKKYGDDFNSFQITLIGKDDPEDKVLVTLSREGFFFWRVTNVLLPLS